LPLLVVIVIVVIVAVIDNALFATFLPNNDVVVVNVIIITNINGTLLATLLPHDALFDILLPLLVVIVIVIFGIITTWFGGFGSSQHAAFLHPRLVITTIIALFANAPHLLLVIVVVIISGIISWFGSFSGRNGGNTLPTKLTPLVLSQISWRRMHPWRLKTMRAGMSRSNLGC
jgi:hypothetical protein